MLLSLSLAVSSTCVFSQVVYVANTISNDVSAFSVDPGSGALTAIPGSPFPAWPVPIAPFQDEVIGPTGVAIDPTGKFLYVANPRSGDRNSAYISAFTTNAATGSLTAIPGSPFSLGAFPQVGAVAVDPTGKFVYAANQLYSTILGFTINAGAGVLTAVPGSPFAADVGIGAGDLVVSPTGKYVYSTGCDLSCSCHFPGVLSVYTVNASSGVIGKVTGSPFAAGVGPASVAVDPTGKFLYVPVTSTCDFCNGGVLAFSVSAASGALIAIPGSPFPDTGLGPYGSAVDPMGKFLFVSNFLIGQCFSGIHDQREHRSFDCSPRFPRSSRVAACGSGSRPIRQVPLRSELFFQHHLGIRHQCKQRRFDSGARVHL